MLLWKTIFLEIGHFSVLLILWMVTRWLTGAQDFSKMVRTIWWKSFSHVQLFVTPWTVTVHGILLARILEWVAIPFSRGSSQPRDWAQVSRVTCGFFTSWATRGKMGRAERRGEKGWVGGGGGEDEGRNREGRGRGPEEADLALQRPANQRPSRDKNDSSSVSFPGSRSSRPGPGCSTAIHSAAAKMKVRQNHPKVLNSAS